MAGILDSKTRIIDSVITEIGRSQIANGQLKISFASLTDAASYYELGDSPGPTDATSRIYFEAPGKKKQDFITFETDDSGALLGYPESKDLSISGESLFKSTPEANYTDLNSAVFVSGAADFASLSAGIVTSSIDNFKELYMLGTTEERFGNTDLSRDFKLNTNNVNFKILNGFPFVNGPDFAVSDIDSVECLFLDKRLSHIPNFKFLPPLVVEPTTTLPNGTYRGFDIEAEYEKSISSDSQVFLGSYVNLNEAENLTYQDLKNGLDGPGIEWDPDNFTSTTSVTPPWISPDDDFSDLAAISILYNQGTDGTDSSVDLARERQQITFNQTSNQNNIVMQMFETDSNTLKFKKLDVIDFGSFITEEARSEKRVFFAGKVFLNSNKIPTYVNIFTIIMD